MGWVDRVGWWGGLIWWVSWYGEIRVWVNRKCDKMYWEGALTAGCIDSRVYWQQGVLTVTAALPLFQPPTTRSADKPRQIGHSSPPLSPPTPTHSYHTTVQRLRWRWICDHRFLFSSWFVLLGQCLGTAGGGVTRVAPAGWFFLWRLSSRWSLQVGVKEGAGGEREWGVDEGWVDKRGWVSDWMLQGQKVVSGTFNKK